MYLLILYLTDYKRAGKRKRGEMVAVDLPLVAVAQLVSGVHRGAGSLVQPDAVYNAHVRVADDAERQQVLNADQEQSVGMAEVNAPDLREHRVADTSCR